MSNERRPTVDLLDDVLKIPFYAWAGIMALVMVLGAAGVTGGFASFLVFAAGLTFPFALGFGVNALFRYGAIPLFANLRGERPEVDGRYRDTGMALMPLVMTFFISFVALLIGSLMLSIEGATALAAMFGAQIAVGAVILGLLSLVSMLSALTKATRKHLDAHHGGFGNWVRMNLRESGDAISKLKGEDGASARNTLYAKGGWLFLGAGLTLAISAGLSLLPIVGALFTVVATVAALAMFVSFWTVEAAAIEHGFRHLIAPTWRAAIKGKASSVLVDDVQKPWHSFAGTALAILFFSAMFALMGGMIADSSNLMFVVLGKEIIAGMAILALINAANLVGSAIYMIPKALGMLGDHTSHLAKTRESLAELVRRIREDEARAEATRSEEPVAPFEYELSEGAAANERN